MIDMELRARLPRYGKITDVDSTHGILWAGPFGNVSDFCRAEFHVLALAAMANRATGIAGH